MIGHNLMLFLFFLCIYSMFYVPTAKVIDTFHENQKAFLDPRTGLNLNDIRRIGLSNLPRLPSHLIGSKNNECLSQGMYLGEEQQFQNCELLCNSKDVYYKFLDQDHSVIYNNRKLTKGSWCLPKEYNSCNLSVSRIIWNDKNSEWTCQSKYQLFGGPGNNQIKGCNGVLLDTQAKKTYTNYIPPDLNINYLDEKWFDPKTNSYRYIYECGPSSDMRGNRLVRSNLGSRFDVQRNYCAKYLYRSRLSEPKYNTGTCECQNPLENINKNPALPCTSCKQGFTRTGSAKYRDAFSINVMCAQKTTPAEDLDPKIQYVLCGKDRFDNFRTACMSGIMLIASADSRVKQKDLVLDINRPLPTSIFVTPSN